MDRAIMKLSKPKIEGVDKFVLLRIPERWLVKLNWRHERRLVGELNNTGMLISMEDDIVPLKLTRIGHTSMIKLPAEVLQDGDRVEMLLLDDSILMRYIRSNA